MLICPNTAMHYILLRVHKEDFFLKHWPCLPVWTHDQQVFWMGILPWTFSWGRTNEKGGLDNVDQLGSRPQADCLRASHATSGGPWCRQDCSGGRWCRQNCLEVLTTKELAVSQGAWCVLDSWAGGYVSRAEGRRQACRNVRRCGRTKWRKNN